MLEGRRCQETAGRAAGTPRWKHQQELVLEENQEPVLDVLRSRLLDTLVLGQGKMGSASHLEVVPKKGRGPAAAFTEALSPWSLDPEGLSGCPLRYEQLSPGSPGHPHRCIVGRSEPDPRFPLAAQAALPPLPTKDPGSQVLGPASGPSHGPLLCFSTSPGGWAWTLSPLASCRLCLRCATASGGPVFGRCGGVGKFGGPRSHDDLDLPLRDHGLGDSRFHGGPHTGPPLEDGSP